MRAMSALSQLPYFVDDSREYVAFAGYIFSYSTFVTIYMWGLSGTGYYRKLLVNRKDEVELIKSLNKFDTKLQSLLDDSCLTYIKCKFVPIVQEMDSESKVSTITAMLEA